MTRRHLNSGAPAELLVIQRVIALGWTASLPFGAKAAYDLIADTGTKLLRIQVKTIYRGKTDNGTRWMVDFLKPRGIQGKTKKYSLKDCDVIVAACPEKDRCFVIPIADCAHRRQATFHIEDAPSPMARHKNWQTAYDEAWSLLQ